MLLEVSDLRAHYGKIQALHGVTLSVDAGEIVALIGANGAGKTTTLKAISGARSINGGSIKFNDQDVTGMAAHKLVQLGIGQSPEGRGIFPGMTVLENLEMGAYWRHRASKTELQSDFSRVYELFPVLHERRKQYGGTLSGGEQQLLAIGRALMAQPKLLLLDEPSMGLAPQRIQQVFEIITTIRQQGTTVLLVEQNATQALQRADRAYVMEGGRVVREGAASELLDDESIRAIYLGGEHS